MYVQPVVPVPVSAHAVLSRFFRPDGVVSTEGMEAIGRARAATGLSVDELTLDQVAPFAHQGGIAVVTESHMPMASKPEVYVRPIGGRLEAKKRALAEQEAAEAARLEAEAARAAEAAAAEALQAEQEAAAQARAEAETKQADEARRTEAAVASVVRCSHAGCKVDLMLDTGYVTLPDRLRVVDEAWLRREVRCQGHRSPGSIRVEVAKRQVASAKARAEAETREADRRGEEDVRSLLKRRR